MDISIIGIGIGIGCVGAGFDGDFFLDIGLRIIECSCGE